ncbi:hypothetical protein [Candidatus Villigracilis saccharophilus]
MRSIGAVFASGVEPRRFSMSSEHGDGIVSGEWIEKHTAWK